MGLRIGLILALVPALGAAAGDDFFENRVRPLLAAKCYACHTEAKMGGLRVDSRAALEAGGARGAAIRPGDPSASLLVRAIRRDDPELKMPPTEALAADEVAAIEKWIADGAPWPEAKAVARAAQPGAIRPEARQFWAFRPVRRPTPPAAGGAHPIDAFLLDRLRREGLEPAPEADRRTWIRRATLDLLGLPPTPEEIAAFLADDSSQAFERVADRLLESPHYGVRMARRWLDLARYGDGRSGAAKDDPLPNAWRYRDWVVEAFNRDLPYDRFIEAQLAADLLPAPDCDTLLPALGFHALLDRDDDRVDVTTRTFLGLTVACAQCHDHKFDPIPQSDYYSLQGVFESTQPFEAPLAPEEQVKAYEEAKQRVAAQKRLLDRFLERQREQLVEVLMERTADYLMAAWRVKVGGAAVAEAASEAALDEETLGRWLRYLDEGEREHPYLDEWIALLDRRGGEQEARRAAEDFERTLFAIREERRGIEDRNYVKLGGEAGVLDERTLLNTNLEFLDPVKFYLWRDLATEPTPKYGFDFPGGVYYYGPKEIGRFLSGVWGAHLEREREELARLEKAVPPPYPFLHAYRDAPEPKDVPVLIRGEKSSPGEIAPRRFLAILSPGEPPRFSQGSGRLELARAIASPENPLTARVMANRLWQWRFGRGLVGTPSNFGQLGERPTHPELLDWLAAELVDGGWSIKALDRQIVLSAAYRRSSLPVAANLEKDPANERLWRFPPRDRLDAETLRDAILAVSGRLDPKLGGPAEPLSPKHVRRALYGTVARTSPDPTMILFDFPDPKMHAEERAAVVGPLQRLFFLNNPFAIEQAGALAERLDGEAGPDAAARVARAYELVYGRSPTDEETALGAEFASAEGWARYAQMLLASSEFFTLR